MGSISFNGRQTAELILREEEVLLGRPYKDRSKNRCFEVNSRSDNRHFLSP